ncbi:MAG TPA: alpha/beta fold hydrolase [Anaerolineales bacterium]
MKSRTLFFITLALMAALLAGCAARQTPVPVVPEGAQAGELIGLNDCEYQPADANTKYAAQCGTLVVPEVWEKGGSRLIALPVVRIPASGQSPAEPVFYLQGGPGQSNFSWAPPGWLLARHDLVFVGYRGIDGTVRLSCPQVSRAMKAHAGRDLLSPQARAEYVGAVKECAAAHQAAGVDLSGYTIPGVVEDMEAARTALGYHHIDLLGESYGTRVEQIYAYMHPESLHRLILVGVNTPGHFVWAPAVFDGMIAHISDLCARDASCSSRTDNLARTIYSVNHNMPGRWLFFNIDPDTVRLGTQFLLLDSPTMPLVFDAYLAAGKGDPSGLAMLNLLTSLAPIDQQVFGDLASKAGTVDLEKYGGIESVSLGDSIMGAPMAEWIWPIAKEWPLQSIPQSLREFQESDVEMLLVNGSVDFSTPPTALDEARPYFHKVQTVLLPEFGHISDVMKTLQPQAFERLVTSYYDTGVADSSLYVYEPVSFEPAMSLVTAGRLLIAVMILLPLLIVLGVLLVVRRIRRRRAIPAQVPGQHTAPQGTGQVGSKISDARP